MPIMNHPPRHRHLAAAPDAFTMPGRPFAVPVRGAGATAIVGAIAALHLGTCALGGGSIITFEEDAFDVVTLSIETVSTGPGSSTSVTQAADGGNPGAFLSISHSIPAGPPPGGFCANWAWVFVFPAGASIVPALVGGIDEIEFSIESSYLASSPPLLPQSRAPAIRQGGRLYIVGGGVVSPSGGWSTLSLPGLSAADFIEVVNLAPCQFGDAASHPDFSISGGLIELGFASGNSSGLGGNPQSTQVTYGVDNWSVTVSTVGVGPCAGDLDGNGVVGGADLGLLLAEWGKAGSGPADLNGDTVVDGADLGILLAAWGECD